MSCPLTGNISRAAQTLTTTVYSHLPVPYCASRSILNPMSYSIACLASTDSSQWRQFRVALHKFQDHHDRPQLRQARNHVHFGTSARGADGI